MSHLVLGNLTSKGWLGGRSHQAEGRQSLWDLLKERRVTTEVLWGSGRISGVMSGNVERVLPGRTFNGHQSEEGVHKK